MTAYLLILIPLTYQLLINSRNTEISTQYYGLKCARNKSNIFLVLYFFLLVLIFAFRDLKVGTDTESYYEMFENFNLNTAKISKEPLFWILVGLTKCLNLPYYCLLILIAIFAFGGFYILIKNAYGINKSYLLLFFVFFVYTSSFNGMRQFMALSWFCCAILSLINDNIYRYLLYCTIAILCHSSAIVLIPIFVIKFLKINWKTIILILFLSIILIFAFPIVTKLISNFTAKDYYTKYLTNNVFSSTTSVYLILYSMGLLVAFFWFFYLKKFINEIDQKRYNIFLFLFFISVCIRIIATFSGYFMLVNRFTMYFFWSIIFLLAYSIKYFPFEKRRKCYAILLYLGTIIYFSISAIVRRSGNIYPYIFNEQFNIISKIIVLLTLFIIVFEIIYFNYIIEKNKGKYYEKKDKCNCSHI